MSNLEDYMHLLSREVKRLDMELIKINAQRGVIVNVVAKLEGLVADEKEDQ